MQLLNIGIIANSNNQKDFFFLNNIEIQNSLLKLALDKKIKKTIFLGTSCIYPKFENTYKRNSVTYNTLEKTNQCYAIAKIAGFEIHDALYEDFKLNIICLMPTNVYGENDNFNKVIVCIKQSYLNLSLQNEK